MAAAFAEHGIASSSNPAARVPLGQQLLGAGKLTEGEIVRIVSVQRERNILFGEAAIGLGYVSRQDIQQALALQFDYPRAPAGNSPLSPRLVAASQPHSAQCEALRALRTQLLLRWFGDRRNSLAVTASRNCLESSSLAANLAILFAQLGERTLLIDANLRAPSQQHLFGIDGGMGLCDVLTGRRAAHEVARSIPGFETLSVLTAGAPPPNPQELLSRVEFSYLVETAPASFDIVIVDTPPILECADAQIVASLTKACVLAIKRHRTRTADISRVQLQLQPAAAELVGAVMFD